MAVKPRDSVVAEMMAAVNALYHAAREKQLRPGDIILVQTDCVQAISAFNKQRKVHTLQEMEVIEKYTEFNFNLFTQTRFRYVQGHSNVDNARNVVQNKCDKMARRAMRCQRAEFLNIAEVDDAGAVDDE